MCVVVSVWVSVYVCGGGVYVLYECECVSVCVVCECMCMWCVSVCECVCVVCECVCGVTVCILCECAYMCMCVSV